MPRQPAAMPAHLLSIVARVKEALWDNRLYANDSLPSSPTGMEQLAFEITEQIVCVKTGTFPRLVQRAGLLFVVTEGLADNEADWLDVSVWNGRRWVTVDRMRLP